MACNTTLGYKINTFAEIAVSNILYIVAIIIFKLFILYFSLTCAVESYTKGK